MPNGKPIVMVVVGTRPEAIKMLPVIHELQASDLLRPFVVSTGQHLELVRSVLALGGVLPDVDLAIGRPGLSLNELFGEVVSGLDAALREHFGAPDSSLDAGKASHYPAVALVHGDTSSAAAAAVVAFHLRMPVVHVEAGLRTYLAYSPFPEEINRQVISRIAAFHFAPTWEAAENLIDEDVSNRQVFVTGNTAIDAVLWASELDLPASDATLGEWLESDRELVVVTAHRRENWGPGIENIGHAIHLLADRHPQVGFVLPLHPNPRVAEPIREQLSGRDNVLLTEPLDYTTFSHLLKRARFAISDSGGIQEEGPALHTPVLVTRESTEREEAVVAGTVRLVGTDVDEIVSWGEKLLRNGPAYQRMVQAENPFGDGHAAERIVRMLEYLSFGTERPGPFQVEDERAVVLKAAGYSSGLVETARAAPGRGMVTPPPRLPTEPITRVPT